MTKVVDLTKYKKKKQDERIGDKLTVGELEAQVEDIAEQSFEQLAEMVQHDYRTNPVYFSGEMFRQVIGQIDTQIKRNNQGAVWLLNYIQNVAAEYLDMHDCWEDIKTHDDLDMRDDFFWHRLSDTQD